MSDKAMYIDKMRDGIISPNSKRGPTFGFTSELFGGYLWKKNKEIIISAIISKKEGCGHLSKLFSAIENHGFTITVPTPMGKMKEILKHKGFKRFLEKDDHYDFIEVWRKV